MAEKPLPEPPAIDRAADGGDGPRPPAALSRAMKGAPWWHETKAQIAAGVAIALVVGFITPAGHWLLGAADSARDVLREMRSYDAGKVDDLKERIRGRPYWQGNPAMIDRLGAITVFSPALITRIPQAGRA